MDEILKLLHENRKLWFRYMFSFGANKTEAEDFIQAMYLKIYDYCKKNGNSIMYNDTEINTYFVYITLRNMYIEQLRKSSKFKKCDLKDEFIQNDIEYKEEDLGAKKEALNRWQIKLQTEIQNEKNYTRKKSELMYYQFIFEKVFKQGMQISELGRLIGISHWSIRNTIKIIKKQITNELRPL